MKKIFSILASVVAPSSKLKSSDTGTVDSGSTSRFGPGDPTATVSPVSRSSHGGPRKVEEAPLRITISSTLVWTNQETNGSDPNGVERALEITYNVVVRNNRSSALRDVVIEHSLHRKLLAPAPGEYAEHVKSDRIPLSEIPGRESYSFQVHHLSVKRAGKYDAQVRGLAVTVTAEGNEVAFECDSRSLAAEIVRKKAHKAEAENL